MCEITEKFAQLNIELDAIFDKGVSLCYIRNNSIIKNKIVEITNFLPIECSIAQRIFHIRNNLSAIPGCVECSSPVFFVSLTKGYRTFCSVKCAVNSASVLNKRKATNLQKFGVDNPFGAESIKHKIKQTNIEKYGVDHIFKSEEIKTKIGKTNLKKYGAQYPIQLAEVKYKRNQNNLQKYGVEYTTQLEEVKHKRKQTNLKKYGVEYVIQLNEFKEKRKKTNLQVYNVEHPIQLDEIKEKRKKTNLERYGVEHPLQLSEYQDKQKQTNLKKYGVEHASQSDVIKLSIKTNNLKNYGVICTLHSPKIKEKTKQNNLQKYGVEFATQDQTIKHRTKHTVFLKFLHLLLNSDRLKNKVKPLFSINEYKGTKNNIYNFECCACNNTFESSLANGIIPRCFKCYPAVSGISSYEATIFLWLTSLGITSINKNNRKVIPPYELDIYLPDYNLAIEFDGIYHHSEIGGNKDKNYHLNKTKLCNEKGIQLIHIFEDEWIDKQDIIKSIIKNKLGIIDTKIFARKCIIKEISSEDSYNFLFENHLQEPIYSKHNYGLYYGDELVYTVCLSKPRFNKKYQYELIRSCGKINTQVIGGFDKLISYAVKTLNIQSMISYVDKRYFNGSGYKNNWKFIKETKPDYFYMSHYDVRYHRTRYQKHKLKKLFSEHYDNNLTEWQIMQLAGYDRIWDCGNLVFEYRRQNA